MTDCPHKRDSVRLRGYVCALIAVIVVAGVRASDIDDWCAAPDSPAGQAAFARITADRAHLVEMRQMAAEQAPGRRARAAVLLASMLTPADLVREIARPETDGVACQVFIASLFAPGDMPDSPNKPDDPIAESMPPCLRGIAAADLRAAAARLAADADWRVRCGAADLLAAAGTGAVSPLHHALLRDPAWPVRSRAIEALGAVSTTAGVFIARAYVAQADPTRLDDRMAAVCALARAGAWGEVLRAFADPAPDMQRLAVGAMLRAPGFTPAVREALPTQVRCLSDRQARSAAQNLIRRMKEEMRGSLP